MNMFFRELEGSTYRLQPLSYFNCTAVLFFLFLTTVTLCGLLQLHYFKNLWSEYMPDLLVTCVMIMVLLKLLLAERRHFHTTVQVYKILHHLACTCLPSGHIHVF